MTSLLLDNPGIDIFGMRIYAYAIIIISGMLVAFFLISLLFKRRNISSDVFLTYFTVGLPLALIFTRLFYCITDGMPFSEWFSISSIRQGGMSIIGGIIGGAIGVIIVSIVKKVDFFRAGDCIVIGLLLAQAIGRWGNFANQEVYGGEVTASWMQCFPFAVYINPEGSCMDTFTLTFSKWFGGNTTITGGEWHYAFFFYESLLNFIAGIGMFLFAWKNPKKPNGIIIGWYFAHYGLVRSIMEPLRDSEFILSGGGVPWSMVLSIIMFVVGVAFIVYRLWYNKKTEGCYVGSLKGDPYGITEYIKDNKNEKVLYSKINMMCAIYPERYEKEEKDENKSNEDAVK